MAVQRCTALRIAIDTEAPFVVYYLKWCFHYGCAALRCALRAIVKTLISSLFNGNHFHYSCAVLHCAACCDKYRNTDSVSILLFTI